MPSINVVFRSETMTANSIGAHNGLHSEQGGLPVSTRGARPTR